MNTYAPGAALCDADKQAALARYVNRFTGDHRPEWAHGVQHNNFNWGKPWPLQFADDADWLDHTDFPVRKDGRLAARGDCRARPTWPNNPELRRASA